MRITKVKILSQSLFLLFLVNQLSAQQWQQVQTWGGSGNDACEDLLISRSGDRYLTGTYQSTLSMGVHSIASFGETDFFISRIDEEGTVEWLIGGGSANADEVKEMEESIDGSLLITGSYWQSATFGPLSLTTDQNPKALYILNVSTSGEFLWAEQIKGTDLKQVEDLKIDKEGNILLGGYFGGSLTVQDTVLHATGSTDLFVIKLSKEGALIWAKQEGWEGDTRITALAIGPDNSIAAGGFYNERTLLGPDTLVANTTDRDVFIARMDASGNTLWARKAGGVHNDDLSDIVVDQSTGDIIGTGFLVGVMKLSEEISIESGNGNSDFYLLKYDWEGNPLQAKVMGGTLVQQTSALRLDGGELYLTGFYQGTIETDAFTVTSIGDISGFLAIFDLDLQATALYSLDTDLALLPSAIELGPQIWIGGTFRGTALLEEEPHPATGGFDIFVADWVSVLNSVEGNEIRSSFSVFPNPVRDWISIHVDPEIDRIYLYHINGQFIAGYPAGREINLGFLDQGMYLLQIETRAKGVLESHIITKQ